MSGLSTSLVQDAHVYTRAKSPWILGDPADVTDRLVHYLSGGGLRTFGRTVAQEMARAKQRRFYVVAAALAAVWLFFYFF